MDSWKKASGKKDISVTEYEKMYGYLLGPIGCPGIPGSIEKAVRDYLAAFRRQKTLLNREVDPALETEVIKGLRIMGYNLDDVAGNDEIQSGNL